MHHFRSYLGNTRRGQNLPPLACLGLNLTFLLKIQILSSFSYEAFIFIHFPITLQKKISFHSQFNFSYRKCILKPPSQQGTWSCGPNYFSVYVSFNSKPDHAPRQPRGFTHFHGLGVGFSPNFLCPGGQGFELERFSTVLKEKCKNFQICFKKTRGGLKSKRSCAVSYQFLQTQQMFPGRC